MSAQLPPQLLQLFLPRPPLRWLPPHDHAPEERRTVAIDGVASFLPALAEKAAIADTEPVPISESWLQRRDRVQREKEAKQRYLKGDGAKELYRPNEDKNIRGDAFKTLFVGRLPYSTVSKDLEMEFGRYGPIERVRIVMDTNEKGEIKPNAKPRGYAFVLFEREQDMKSAYKECERLSIRGRPVLVDVERGRTVTDWKPRRFGGGLGGRHYTKVPAKPSGGYGGPPMGPGHFRSGGFRGGFNDRGGGFRGGRGGGGFRGGFDRSGGRGGGGYPDGAPAGPRGGYGGGFGGRGGDDRGFGGGRGGRDNANFEPLPPRGGGGGGYRDRDRDRDGSGGGGGRDSYNPGQKRSYDGGGYDDARQRRRY